jgi:hypothetical protein
MAEPTHRSRFVLMVRLEAPDGRLADPGSEQVGFFFGQQQRALTGEEERPSSRRGGRRPFVQDEAAPRVKAAGAKNPGRTTPSSFARSVP